MTETARQATNPAQEAILRAGCEVLVNLTPHPINIHRPDGAVDVYLPAGMPVRLDVTDTEAGAVDGVPVKVATYGAADALPDAQAGVWHVVAGMVVDALPARADLLAPHDLVRDGEGRVVGCRALRRARAIPEALPVRQRLRAFRDLREQLPDLVAEARASGVPWAELAADAGMTREGLDKAMRRRET